MKFFEKKRKYKIFSENILKSVQYPGIIKKILKIPQVGVGGGARPGRGGGQCPPAPPSGYGHEWHIFL